MTGEKKMSLSSIQDTDEIFAKWEESIDAYYKNLEGLTIAESNYESVLAQKIVEQRPKVGATLAKDVARGLVTDQYNERGEAERKVKAGKEKLNFLKELNVDRRMRQREDQKIVGG